MRFCRTEISDEMIREVVDPLWAPDRDGCSVKRGESRASEVGVVARWAERGSIRGDVGGGFENQP